jgi:hypothetical protein
MHTPLANTQAKLDEIEREHPDFQLYLLSKDGARKSEQGTIAESDSRLRSLA